MYHAHASIALRVQLALCSRNPISVAAFVLAAVAVCLLVLVSEQRDSQRKFYRTQLVQSGAHHAPAVSAPDPDEENRQAFYAALGEQRYAEEQVRTLFGLADKAGLSLNQGQYRQAYDSNSRVYTYHITLPVKGSFTAVRQFAMMALEAIPFASLDEISFRREAVGDPNVEARVEFTLYLSGDKP